MKRETGAPAFTAGNSSAAPATVIEYTTDTPPLCIAWEGVGRIDRSLMSPETGLKSTTQAAEGGWWRAVDTTLAALPSLSFAATEPARVCATILGENTVSSTTNSLVYKNLIHKTLLSLAVAATASGQTLAEEDSNTGAVKSAPVVVTATRFNASIDTAPVNIITIDAEDIANSGANNITDVLRYQPGVNVSSLFGINDSRSTIDLGGFGENGSSNTLILLNGRRLNDFDLQGASLATIPVDSIARIEIVQGSSTVLYGDNAVGGVINIVTKSALDGEGSNVAVEIGSYDTRRMTVGLRKMAGDTAVSLNVDSLKSDGYRQQSAIENLSVMGELSRESGDWLYGTRINANNENLELPGYLYEPEYLADPTASTATLEKAEQKRYAIEAFAESANGLATEITYSRKRQKATVYGDTRADLDTLSFTPRYKRQYGRNTLTMGLDAYLSRLDATGEFTNYAPPPATNINNSDSTRRSYGLYLTDSIAFGNDINLDLGYRHQRIDIDITNRSNVAADTSDNRRDHLNAADITLSHKHHYGGRNYVRLARSFRAPVLDEMWSYYYGSIDLLKPQTADHLEIGTRQNFSNGINFNANLFVMLLENEIAFDQVTYSNVNLDKTRRDGVNLSLHSPIGKQASVQAGYAWRKATYRAGSNDGKNIPLVPRNKFTLGGQYDFDGNTHLGINAIYTGSRYFGNDYANAGKKLDGYTRVDLNYRHSFGAWQVRMLVQNLINTKTTDTGFYDYGNYSAGYTPSPYTYYPLPERTFYMRLGAAF